jgi:serine/threonine-protein kinase RsbW
MHPPRCNYTFRARTVDLALDEHAHGIQVHSPAELRPFFEKLEDWMRVLGYPGKDIFAVTLALYEAANNAFRHGNRGDRGKTFRVRYVVTMTEVLLEVEDQGLGFDPDEVPDPLHGGIRDRPGGRGLFLMRTYMTWVSFNREGNRVTLGRQRSGA